MKQTITLLLIGLMLNSIFYVSSAKAASLPDNADKQAKIAEKLKMELQKLGVGKESKVEVKLIDGTKISGYLSEINDEDFVVVSKNDDPNRIPYRHVRKAKGRYGYHHFAVSGTVLGILLGVLLLTTLSGNSNSNY